MTCWVWTSLMPGFIGTVPRSAAEIGGMTPRDPLSG
jgi:hypothetical protein